jgi:hypothetical protein
MEQGRLTVKHWRKSAQWASLNRKHAKLVADDMQVADVFAKHCRVGKDKKTGKEHLCISDEAGHPRNIICPASWAAALLTVVLEACAVESHSVCASLLSWSGRALFVTCWCTSDADM